MKSTFILKTEYLKNLFLNTSDPSEKHKIIIDLGRSLPQMPEEQRVEKNRVKGCQSILYLQTFLEEDVLKFYVDCDALVSKGLAAILIQVYEGLTIQDFLKSPPDFIKDLNILSSISINRSNGFANIYQKIKNDTLTLLLSTQ